MDGQDKVLIFGIDSPIGLALVRELGQHGVDVYGIGQSRRAISLYSRFLKQGYIFSGPHETLIPFVREIARKHGISCLMTVAENDILFFNQQRSELQELKFLFADEAAMSIVLSKEKTYAIAQATGIEIPLSVSLQNIEELHSLSSQILYPVILKWSNPLHIQPLLSQQHIAFLKTEYCYTPDELYHSLTRYLSLGQFPLIQSFCPGHGLGHMIFMHNKEPLLVFQHRRLHEWPPEGGVSTLCESIAPTENQPLLEQSIELLRRIGWEGPAMVEYRFDPARQKAILMEINGRFWGSLPLAYHARAPFAWYTYSVLGKGIVPSCPPYRVGLRCMYMVPELKRLAIILFRSDFIQNKALHFNRFKELADLLCIFLNPKEKYYVFSFNDPCPAFMDMYHILVKGVHGLKSRFFKHFRNR